MEGYGSLRIEGDQGTSKLRFSFVFSLPHRGRIESFDPLGRPLSIILIDEGGAYFVLPSRKVYWRGDEEEIISKFIGFRLNQIELINLLRGQWESDGVSTRSEGEKGNWEFTCDERGRIIEGQRGEFRFEIKEFFPGSQFARLVLFSHTLSKGTVKVFTVNFNQPVKPGAFSSSFLEKYSLKTWAEIEKLLSGNES